MNFGTQTGKMLLAPVKAGKDKYHVAIVSNHADHILPSSYSFSVEPFKWRWKYWCW